jgi:hypothetical protein
VPGSSQRSCGSRRSRPRRPSHRHDHRWMSLPDQGWSRAVVTSRHVGLLAASPAAGTTRSMSAVAVAATVTASGSSPASGRADSDSHATSPPRHRNSRTKRHADYGTVVRAARTGALADGVTSRGSSSCVRQEDPVQVGGRRGAGIAAGVSSVRVRVLRVGACWASAVAASTVPATQETTVIVRTRPAGLLEAVRCHDQDTRR